jgi:rubredoxin
MDGRRIRAAIYHTSGGAVTIEITGGKIINERGTVVTFRQKCEVCGYVYDFNKTTIVPAYGSRKVRAFTCPECGNYQEVEARHYREDPDSS